MYGNPDIRVRRPSPLIRNFELGQTHITHRVQKKINWVTDKEKGWYNHGGIAGRNLFSLRNKVIDGTLAAGVIW
ncbi:hypothetical protein GCM10007352_19140 [Mucilaginibacter phyllosphaerae]|nr:hypothetical protein GCM10007352_19140 [Mucilaginibacter phyllosphaerae]